MYNNNCSNLQDIDKFRLPEQVLIVKLGLNQPETMLEQHQPFISEKKTLFLVVFGFPGKLHVCSYNCSNLQDMDKCRLPEQMLTVRLGLNQPETMLEQHQPFISEKKTLFLAVFGFHGKLHVCNSNCSNLQDMDKCRLPEQVLIVKLGLNQPETMLEQYQPFISEKKLCFYTPLTKLLARFVISHIK